MFRIYSRSKGFIYVRQMNEATTKTLSKCTFTSFRCDIRKPFVKLTNLISTVWLSDLCYQFYCKKVKIECLGFSIFIGYCMRCLFQFPEIAPNWIPLYSFLYFYLSVLPSEPNYYSFNIYRFIVGLTCWKKYWNTHVLLADIVAVRRLFTVFNHRTETAGPIRYGFWKYCNDLYISY